jgi:hypothetical protein
MSPIQITINGASDDLIQVEGCEGADEFYLSSAGGWQGDLVGPDPADQLRVWCWLDDDSGAWQVGVGQVLEAVPMASWPVKFSQDPNGYSARLTIEAPEGTRITNIRPGPDDA